ncbi:MAG: hypothetical protein E6Q97_12465 [Desulfurellales bacterium]|nr:MAG: hypothetical protein E6Q97_12465 [Desulfurellales bacterium]
MILIINTLNPLGRIGGGTLLTGETPRVAIERMEMVCEYGLPIEIMTPEQVLARLEELSGIHLGWGERRG